ncbi:three component ABC system middle component [Clostridium tyrobutyricum]|uniref:three component ABC system middle component n=1 Tax=Clostridium tyrobutyricum TaxID=1519 RepID=UPI00057CA71C|nr:three component ABC system middle component [Clostridium tyrobutyricum]
MKNWSERPKEIAYLLNPSFCALLIYCTIKEYEKKCKRKVPFMLIYLILPIVLHKNTRQLINSKSIMHTWIQKNAELLINFNKRTRNMIEITNEAVEFLLGCKIINISNTAEISIEKIISTNKQKYTDDEEILDCINKAGHIGRWFAKSGSTEAIYSMWGVRP